MASDGFTRDLFAWLRRVAVDVALPPLAVRVAVILSSRFNRKTREAWPTQATIAGELASTERGVRGALEELVERGYLGRSRAHKRASNRYRFVTDDRNTSSSQQDGLTGTPLPLTETFERNAPSGLRGTGVPVGEEDAFLSQRNFRNEPSKELSIERARKKDADLFGSDDARHPPAKPKPNRRKPNLPITDDYSPNDRTIALNAELGFSEADLVESAERMKAWARSKDERKADWNAAHQNWIRKDAERRRGSPNEQAPSSWLGIGADGYKGETP